MTHVYRRNCEISGTIEFPEGMQRIALGVEYNGAVYNGFQKQTTTQNTVQAKLELALSKIADESVTLICAGRTDTGVHASEQVVHFDTYAQRPEKAWVLGVNNRLPAEVRVHWSKPVSSAFHARFRALSRTYRYIIYSSKVRPACLHQNITWTRHSLDIEKMQAAAAYFVGEHDFSAFRSSRCQANNPVRTIERLSFRKSGAFIVMEVKANAFLHHMVRNIVGSIMFVGRGEASPEWVAELIALKDRNQAAPTAKPWGLYFVRAEYDSDFALPHVNLGPLFLPPL